MARKGEIRILGYVEIAEKLGVSVGAVKNYASIDPDFPTKITPDSMRSPGFAEADVDRYMAVRALRFASRGQTSGRPLAAGVDRRKLSPAVNAKIGRLIRAAGTFTEFTKLAGISDQALRTRISGVSRWRETELLAFANRLGITVDELVAEPTDD